MFKKIISYISVIALVLSAISPAAALFTFAAAPPLEFHSSYVAATYSTYSGSAWLKKDSNQTGFGGTASITPASTVKYFDGGKDETSTIQCDYTGLNSKTTPACRFYFNGHITNKLTITDAANGFLTFWAYSDQACTLKLRFSDANTSSTWSNLRATELVKVNLVAGAQKIEIPFSEFIKSGTPGYQWKYLCQLSFDVYDIDGNSSESGTIYIDEIGFIDKSKDDAPLSFHNSYKAIDYIGSKGWAKKDSTTSTSFVGEATITQDATDKYFPGGNDTAAAVKCAYKGLTNTTSPACRFYFDGHIQNNLPVVNVNATFLTFWAYSSQACKVKISFVDVDGTNKWSGRAVNTATVNLSGGAQIVKIPLTTFAKDTVDGYLWQYLCQPQFNVYKSDDSAFTAGSLYIDEIGFIDESEVVPTDFHVSYKPAVYTSTVWSSKKYNSGTITLTQDATEQYYSGAEKKDSTATVKASYTGLTTDRTCRFYINDKIKNEVEFTSVNDNYLTFWAYSSQPCKVNLIFWDKSASGQQSKTVSVNLSTGGQIVEIPFADFLPDGKTMEWKTFAQLLFDVYGVSESTAATGDIYIDDIGFINKTLTAPSEEPDPPVVIPPTHIPAQGDNLLYTFDNDTDIADCGWSANFDNSGTAMQLSLEENGTNAYGGNGKSIKVTYDTSKMSGSSFPRIWTGSSKIFTAPYKTTSGISFWIKSEKATKLKFVFGQSNVSGWPAAASDEIEINAGENIVNIPWSQFKNNGAVDLSKLAQVQIRTNNTNEQNTLYFDHFGYYVTPDFEPETLVSKLPGTGKLLYSFDKDKKIDDVLAVWEKNFATDGKGIELSLETDPANIYDGIGKSLKVVYDRASAENTNTNKDLVCIRNKTNITTSGEGFIFWLNSAEATKIKLIGLDNNNVTVTTDPIDIAQGENKVIVKWDDFTGTGTLDLSIIKQLQIRTVGSNKAGTYYLDSFGFYQTPAIHGDDFFEANLNFTKWTKASESVALYSWEEFSDYYHNASTDVKDNGSALKVLYKNLTTGNDKKNSVYYNASLAVDLEEAPQIYGEDSVLSFWVYSEQEVALSVMYSDKDADGNDQDSLIKTITVPKGETIVKIPMKELIDPSKPATTYQRVNQLQIRINATANTAVTSAGNLWIDAIGFYDSNIETNSTPQLMDDKAFTWWDFDDDADISTINWTTRWAGENSEGMTISLDNTPGNVYGGSGQSLKVDYNAALCDRNCPTIWLDYRKSVMGEGLVFWIKCKYQTKIKLVGIDANGNTIVTDKISLKQGENVVVVKYTDFHEQNNNSVELNFTSIMQLQIRSAVVDKNTYWIDNIGFYNITDDGSNNYKSIFPPEKYDDWYDGVSVVGENYDRYVDDCDMKFCSEWYFNSNGWISLENTMGRNILRMDYDFTTSAGSVLTNITQFKGVDPNGGISFRAQSSEERYYSLNVWLGSSTIAITFKAGPQGRTYNIPFSAFWLNNKMQENYSAASNSLVTIQKMTISSNSTVNPPAMGGSKQFSFWLDDIKFVDSAKYKRAGAVDHYENGVRLQADETAFTAGVAPSIKIENLTAKQKEDYLAVMKGSSVFGKLYQINALDMGGISLVPQKAVDLTFDVPAGIDAEDICVYQLFLDGSAARRNVTITDDGKIKASVYRLGNYLIGYSDGSASSGNIITEAEGTSPGTGDNNLLVVATAVLALSALAIVYFSGKLSRKVGKRYEKQNL